MSEECIYSSETSCVLLMDLKHGVHVHCVEGIQRYCFRTGLDFEKLMSEQITIKELESSNQYLGLEVAANARERLGLPSKEEEDQKKEIKISPDSEV